MDAIVYHYCDLNAFQSILKNKTLWLSDVKKSNDCEEGNYLINLIHSYLNYLIQTESCGIKELKNVRELLDIYFEHQETRVYNLDDIEENDKVFEQLGYIPGDELYYDKFEKPLYTTCFSSNGDLLSQWRGYADDGCGVAIGFRTDLLSKWNANIEGMLNKSPIAGFAPVKYMELNEQVIDYTEDLLRRTKNYRSVRNKPEKIILLTSIFLKIDKIKEESILLKSTAFSEEHEYRLFFNDTITFDSRNGIYNLDSRGKKAVEGIKEFYLSELKTRTNKEGIVSYYELNFSNVKDEIIAEIVLGPKCKLSQTDVEFLLSINGFNGIGNNQYDQQKILIRKSKLSYR